MNKYKNIFLTILLIVFLLNIDIVLKSVKEASVLFFDKVFVCIFPFIILCDILLYYDYHLFLKQVFGKYLSKLFGIDKNTSIIFIISILCASPTNAVIIKSMLDNKQIDEQTANNVLSYTVFSSLSFVIGTIGVYLYKSILIGFILWLATLLNNVLIGIYLKKKIIFNKTDYEYKAKKTNVLLLLKSSSLKAINTSFIILGNLIIFTIIINLFLKYIHLNSIANSLIIGTLEITNGIMLVSKLNTNMYAKLFLTTYMLTFSILSILFQSFSILSDYKINIKKILITRLVFSIIYLLIALLLHSSNHYFLF